MKLDGICTLISVFDCEASTRFYRDYLGFEVHQSAGRPDWVWLKREGIDLMLNTMYDPDDQPAAPEAERIASHRDTILFFGCADVDGAFQELRAKGFEVGPPRTAHYGMKQLFLTDPDGYSICLQAASDQ